MKVIVNATIDPSEIITLYREFAGNMKAKPDVDVIASAIAKELGVTAKRPAGRPKKSEIKDAEAQEIEEKIFGSR